jgi:asparagine synthase (glutamine-hydrolysing)
MFLKLNNSIAHRGPDGSGVYRDELVALGHRRLAIIDLSEGGVQPKHSSDSKHVIIYNGEVYNYLELKSEFEKIGVEFSTESDTEVVLESIVECGAEVLHKLNGMFAFMIWSIDEKQLFVARDRFGIKPLYYIEEDDYIALASEVKALLPLMKKTEPNDEIIFDYLASGRVDHLDDTFFKGVKRFPAGHYGIIDQSGFKITKWYDLRERIHLHRKSSEFTSRSIDKHIEMVKSLFSDAVRLRLRSDVPVGSCLSGGIDSSSIVVEASMLLPNETRSNFQVYSAVYGDWFPQSEHKFIDKVVQKTGMTSNRITPTLEILDEAFSKFVYHQEEPVTSTSPFTQYCVMKLAHSNKAKVLLDGQGADEILAGYDYMMGYYLSDLLLSGRLVELTRELMAQIRRKNLVGVKAFLYQLLPTSLQKRFSPRDVNLLSPEFREIFSERQIVDELLYRETSLNESLINHVLHKLQHLLRWEDRNAMAFSIETRVPFLDHNLVEYVLALPSYTKVRRGITKWILRRAVIDLLPPEILDRTDKIGFASPEEIWMNDSKLKLIHDLLASPHPLIGQFVDLSKVNEVIADIGNLDAKRCRLLFRVVGLNTWLEVFFPR